MVSRHGKTLRKEYSSFALKLKKLDPLMRSVPCEDFFWNSGHHFGRITCETEIQRYEDLLKISATQDPRLRRRTCYMMLHARQSNRKNTLDSWTIAINKSLDFVLFLLGTSNCWKSPGRHERKHTYQGGWQIVGSLCWGTRLCIR